MEGLQRLNAVRGQNNQKKQKLNIPDSRLVAPFGTGLTPLPPSAPWQGFV